MPAPLAALLIGSALAYAPTSGRVLVINEASAPMRVTIPGIDARTLAPGERASVLLPLGVTSVRSTYTQLGRSRLLEVDSVDVRAAYTSVIELHDPDVTRVRFTNTTGREGDLMSNGRLLAHLDVGEVETVRVPIGALSVDLVGTDRRTLAHASLTARLYADNVWTFDLPRTGEILVQNAHAIPGDVRIDGVWTGSLPANGSTVVVAPVGSHRLTITDARGRLVEDEWVSVDPWERAFVNVDAVASNDVYGWDDGTGQWVSPEDGDGHGHSEHCDPHMMHGDDHNGAYPAPPPPPAPYGGYEDRGGDGEPREGGSAHADHRR